MYAITGNKLAQRRGRKPDLESAVIDCHDVPGLTGIQALKRLRTDIEPYGVTANFLKHAVQFGVVSPTSV